MDDLFPELKPDIPPAAPGAAGKRSGPDLADLAGHLAGLSRHKVFIGTSSWKYPGWVGQLYNRERYVYRGRFAETRFERECLREYAATFRTVCVDAAYYTFPSAKYLDGLMGQVDAGFQFSLKVTDAITVRKFPNLPRFGQRAGQVNDQFLNVDLFDRAFLRPLEPFRDRVGMLIFEFSRFYPSDFARGRDFLAVLEPFLAALPPGWRYGVEIRNREFLHPDYFECLRRANVAHVFNSWEAMPPVGEQLELDGALTNPEFTGARLLLRPGRKYEEAVASFKPYDKVRDVYPEGRTAALRLIEGALKSAGRRGAYVYVNNRLEGNALETIAAVIAMLVAARGLEPPPAA